jgi:hypothetical protein
MEFEECAVAMLGRSTVRFDLGAQRRQRLFRVIDHLHQRALECRVLIQKALPQKHQTS